VRNASVFALSACALVVAFFFGILIGTVQAVRQYSLLDSGMSVLLLFFYSMPSFWLALMLVLTLSLFAFYSPSDADFYLRGEEYSAQLDHFFRSIKENRPENRNAFSSALLTDRVIQLLIQDNKAS